MRRARSVAEDTPRIGRTARLAVCLCVGLTACAPSLILSKGAGAPEVAGPRPGQAPTTLALIARTSFGVQPTRCAPSAELTHTLRAVIAESGAFREAATPDAAEITLSVCFHDINDARTMEGALIVSALTFGLVPTTYTRGVALDVEAAFRDGSREQYTEADPYTSIQWLPLSPLALYWNSREVWGDMARVQLRRVLAEIQTRPQP